MATLTVQEAFEHCRRRARAHYENFPVGLFVPRNKQPYVHALYAFARAADDFADEPRYEGMRREKLDEWERRVHEAYEGRAEDPIFIALAQTIRDLEIPKPLLLDLISAFRQDTEKQRYDTWEELLDYCRRSADPVGRLVLLVFGQSSPELPAWSDAICTGLQLANHWQDLAIDVARGRLYVPRELLERFSVKEWDLNASRLTPEFQALMAELVWRARALFERGRPLCDRVGRELRFEMRLVWLGGSSILDGIEAAAYDVFRHRPHHGALAKARLAWRAYRWRPAARG